LNHLESLDYNIYMGRCFSAPHSEDYSALNDMQTLLQTAAHRPHDVALTIVPVRAQEGMQGATAPYGQSPAMVRVNGVDVPLHSPGCVQGKDLNKATGLRVYDPGYANTLSCHSAVTAIDGSRGVLSHRGYRLEPLVANCQYSEVTHLIVRGQLPSAMQHLEWTNALYKDSAAPKPVRAALRAMPRDAHPMGCLVSLLAATGATTAKLNPALHRGVYNTATARENAVMSVLRIMPHLAAAVIRHQRGFRSQFLTLPAAAINWSFARRFLYLVDPALVSGRGAPVRIRAIDAILTAHVDHEQNCSTAALRHLASSGVAVVRMLRNIGSKDKVPEYVQRVKRGEERLMGFGHRVYKSYDPRAKVIRLLAKNAAKHAAAGDTKLLGVAEALEKAALADDYFVKRSLFPNVDFYSGFVYLSLGLNPEVFPVLFALGRSAGWMAHWLECLADPDMRIARPHQIYIGNMGPRDVEPLAERSDAKLLPWMRNKMSKM